MINITNFMQKFAEVVEDDTISNLSPNTDFRDLDCWDSLAALSIMAMIDEDYNVNLAADEMRRTNTFAQLVDLIVAKQSQV